MAARYTTAKQSAWILTTISSAIMTLASLPFLYDYFSNGGSVKYVRVMPSLSIAANRFFQSYLLVYVPLFPKKKNVVLKSFPPKKVIW